MSDTQGVAADGRELIVVGVDGFEPSKLALRWAVREAELSGAAVEAVIAWEPPEAFGWMTPPRGAGVDYSANARQVLETTVESVVGADPPVKVQTEVVEGRPASVLERASERADLLVVGYSGRGGVEEVLLGSVSLHCVLHGACPVVVVRGRRARRR